MKLLDGKTLAAQLRAQLKEKIAQSSFVLGLAVVIVGEPYISYSGIMEINDAKQQLNGELVYNETPESLTMEFFSQDPQSGKAHKGKAVLSRKAAGTNQ